MFGLLARRVGVALSSELLLPAWFATPSAVRLAVTGVADADPALPAAAVDPLDALAPRIGAGARHADPRSLVVGTASTPSGVDIWVKGAVLRMS